MGESMFSPCPQVRLMRLYCLVIYLSCFVFFTFSASAVIRWLVLPGLHDCAGEWRWNWRAGKWACGCCKGKWLLHLAFTPLQRCCLFLCLSIEVVALQTEGFDGFTLELWSQLGGNKRKWVILLTHLYHDSDHHLFVGDDSRGRHK